MIAAFIIYLSYNQTYF